LTSKLSWHLDENSSYATKLKILLKKWGESIYKEDRLDRDPQNKK